MWRLSGERKRTGTNKEGDISRCYRPHKGEGFRAVRVRARGAACVYILYPFRFITSCADFYHSRPTSAASRERGAKTAGPALINSG